MSDRHPFGQSLTEYLEHLEAEHGWADEDDLGPCDVCGDPVTDRYSFRSGPAAYTVDVCREHAGLYGRRSY